jgi:putative copper export protein
MSPLYPFMISSYWIFLSGMVFLAGAFTSRMYVTIPSGAYACIPGSNKKCLGKLAIQFIFVVAICTLLSNIVHLILHCSVMTGTPLKEVFSILPLFITKTKYGIFSLMRTIVLMVIIIVLFMGIRNDRIWVTISGIFLSLLLLLTLTMSGHQGTKGYSSIPFVLDVIHVIAITVWIGGIFFIRYCYSFFFKRADIVFWDIFLALINRFSRIATVSVAVVLITGVVLSFTNVGDLTAVTSSLYGKVLLLKASFVYIIMLFGGANKIFFIPRLNSINRSEWSRLTSLRRKLDVSMTIEVFLGLGILLATGILTHLSPGD